MKKTSRFFAFLLTSTLLFSTCCTSFSSDTNLNMSADDEAILVDRESQIIYNKIEELSYAKSAAKQYLTRHSVSFEEALSDPAFAALHQDVKNRREELIEMGVRPSEEMLVDLFASETEVMNNNFNLEEFIALCGNAYDIWGVYQQVNASYGEYFVYNVLVQDRDYGNILATHITQNGAPGFEIFTTGNTSLQNVIESNLLEASFEGIVNTLKETVEGMPVIGLLPSILKTLKSIVDTSDQLADNAAVTVSGNTKSYRIFCDAAPCMNLVYVKDSPDGNWRHTFTTNYTTITETHDWYMVVMQNGSQTILSDERTYQYVKYPARYVYRYTDAIAAYRANSTLYKDLETSYDVIARTPTAVADVFSLEINCPTTRDQLYQYAQ